MFLAKTLKIFDPYCSKLIHCFDSFEGLSEFSEQDAAQGRNLKGMYKGPLEELKEMIDLYELSDDIVLHQGLIEQTLPEFTKKNEALFFSFIYCDTDLYSSTKLVLEQLHPRLMKGGVFVFDEWNFDAWPGETTAANEFLKELGSYYKAEHIRFTRQPSLVLRKIKD